jgi:hypothetical protein
MCSSAVGPNKAGHARSSVQHQCAQQVQLPALRAASFGVVLGTDKLAAFAPQLQQVRKQPLGAHT